MKLPKSMQKVRKQKPYFDYTKAQIDNPKYVAWIDIMGSASVSSISDVISAIYIGKLHACTIDAAETSDFAGNIYPVVDGCYATSADRTELQRFLKTAFRSLALNFLFEDKNEHKFMVRGAISFGNVIESASIYGCSHAFGKRPNYVDGILFGPPLARANHAERQAAPFGIWIDEIARHFCPPGGLTIRHTFWDWWSYPSNIEEVEEHCDEIEKYLARDLHQYLKWCKMKSCEILYPEEAIERHRKIASQYFPSWPDQ